MAAGRDAFGNSADGSTGGLAAGVQETSTAGFSNANESDQLARIGATGKIFVRFNFDLDQAGNRQAADCRYNRMNQWLFNHRPGGCASTFGHERTDARDVCAIAP